MRFSRFIIGLTSCIAFSVQAANVDEYITQLPAGANLALMVQKVGASAPAIDYHSQQMALPASTQKVITALAALIQLGPDFRFTTTLETKGNVENGVLKGDLVARFGADPTLKRQDIRNMVATLKKSGVNQIDGNVLIDTSIFASHDKAPGWPWNDMTQCFSAPPAAAIVDRNCFSVSLYSAPKPGDMAFIRVASYYPVTMFSQILAARITGGSGWPMLKSRPEEHMGEKVPVVTTSISRAALALPMVRTASVISSAVTTTARPALMRSLISEMVFFTLADMVSSSLACMALCRWRHVYDCGKSRSGLFFTAACRKLQ